MSIGKNKISKYLAWRKFKKMQFYLKFKTFVYDEVDRSMIMAMDKKELTAFKAKLKAEENYHFHF